MRPRRKPLVLIAMRDGGERMRLYALLDGAGCDAAILEPGRQALEWAAGSRPDAALSDARPGDPGDARFLADLRAILPETPIVLEAGIRDLDAAAGSRPGDRETLLRRLGIGLPEEAVA